jgi:glycosyltransferase involved in cell wall biosynthesis
MTPISVVIIARNEAHIISRTLQSVHTLTDDIVVIDSGSTDGTQQLCRDNKATVIETGWDGFGPNKNKGIAAAKYDWILSIDSDEMPDEELLASLSSISFGDTDAVYNIRFKTFLGNKLIRFGEWGKDAHIRLFNRTTVSWNNAAVHEQLVIHANTSVKNLKGYILHYTMKDLADYASKMTRYALLNAQGNFQKGKKAVWVKRNLSHRFSFFRNYFLKLGFLDGIEGYWIARMTSYYTFLKYARLHELNQTEK